MLRGFVYTQISYFVISNCVNIVHFRTYTTQFYSPPKHITVGKKVSTHWMEIAPYKHIPMCFSKRCGTLRLPLSLVLYNPPPYILACGAHTSGWGMTLILSITTSSQLCKYCLLWGQYSSWFSSPPKHTVVGGKWLYTLKENHSLSTSTSCVNYDILVNTLKMIKL